MDPSEKELKEIFERRASDVDGITMSRSDVIARSKRRRIVFPALILTFAVLISTIAARAWTGNSTATLDPVTTPSPLSTFPGHPGPLELGDDPSTARVEVARGEYENVPWLIYLTPDERDPSEWCEHLEWDGESSGCPAWVPPGQYLRQGRGGSVGIHHIEGDLTLDVYRIDIRLDGYEPFEAPVIEGPDDPGVNFYLAFVPSGATGSIAVFDREGALLEEQDLLTVFPEIDRLERDLERDLEQDLAAGQRCIAESITIEGTEDDDVLEGTSGSDVIVGLGGDDVITGLGGDDVICGGPGNDRIDGGPGFDEIAGEAGNDELEGGAGFDIVAYWDSPSGVRLDLSQGTAEGEGSDSVSGFEELGGSKHDDVLIGGDGSDQFQGGGGNDVLIGNGGDDLMYAGLGDDRFDGGEGRDAVVFEDPSAPMSERAVDVDLETGVATGHGSDTLISIEVIHGSQGDDTIRGSDADEVLVGRSGNDAIFGGGGDDVLWGDHLRERGGSSYYPAADDQLDGGEGADELHGGPGDNTCEAEADQGDTFEDC